MEHIVSYKNKADEMYEEAMDQVRQEIDEVYEEVEKLGLMVEKVVDDPYEQNQMDEQIGKVLSMLEKI